MAAKPYTDWKSEVWSAIENMEDEGCRHVIKLTIAGEFDDMVGELEVTDYSGKCLWSATTRRHDSMVSALIELGKMLLEADIK